MTRVPSSSGPLFTGRKKALALSLAAITSAIAFTATPAYAQDEVEEVTVTGSRIRMTDGMAAPTPVTVVTPAELNTFDPGGTVAEQPRRPATVFQHRHPAA